MNKSTICVASCSKSFLGAGEEGSEDAITSSAVSLLEKMSPTWFFTCN